MTGFSGGRSSELADVNPQWNKQTNVVTMVNDDPTSPKTTMLAMKDTIEVLKEEGLRDSVKILVGGAPVSSDFAEEIGASAILDAINNVQ